MKPEIVRGDVKPVSNIPCHVLSKKSEVTSELILKVNDKVIKILFLIFSSREDNIYILKPPCNFLFII